MISGMINSIIHADCMDVLRELPDKCVDLVLTDPPYFRIAKNEWDNQWKDITEFQKWVGEIGLELRRIMKDNASFFWFGDDKTIAYCQVKLDKIFHLINSLIWEKPATRASKYIMNMRSFAPVTERILFYEKKGADGKPATGNERIHSMPESFQSIKEYMRGERDKIKAVKGFRTENEFVEYVNALTNTACSVSRHYFADSQYRFPTPELYAMLQKSGFFRREYEDLRREYEDLRRVWNSALDAKEVLKFSIEQKQQHPTQKPLKLISYLIERASRKGSLILDPFSGSGTTAIAAHRLGRRFICIEKDAEYHAASVKRLEAERQQGRLDLFPVLPELTQKTLFERKGN